MCESVSGSLAAGTIIYGRSFRLHLLTSKYFVKRDKEPKLIYIDNEDGSCSEREIMLVDMVCADPQN